MGASNSKGLLFRMHASPDHAIWCPYIVTFITCWIMLSSMLCLVFSLGDAFTSRLLYASRCCSDEVVERISSNRDAKVADAFPALTVTTSSMRALASHTSLFWWLFLSRCLSRSSQTGLANVSCQQVIREHICSSSRTRKVRAMLRTLVKIFFIMDSNSIQQFDRSNLVHC